MMKRADELKPGDVLIRVGQNVVVVAARPVAGGISVIAATIGIGCSMEPPCVYAPEYQMRVDDARELTPAQAHAEELAEVLRLTVEQRRKDPAENEGMLRAIDLLARLDPPVPPTLQETLTALDRLVKGARQVEFDAADLASTLLERARRAGLL